MRNRDSKSQMPIETITPWEWRKRVTYAVLGSFSLSENIPEQIPTDCVYMAFSVLKEKYPKWLGSLHFETYQSTTACKGLEDILFSLGAWGLVTVENRDFRTLRFNTDDKKITKDKMLKHIEEDSNLKDLEDLSNDFATFVDNQIKAGTR